MVFLLSERNIFEYLIEQEIIDQRTLNCVEIEPKICKNFNLLIRCLDSHFFIKQEPHDQDGCTNRDFLNEWRVYELVRSNLELSCLQPSLPEAIHFDPKHSIIIFKYLIDYCDLDEFYAEKRIFPTRIAAALGANLAKVHRLTLDRQDYKRFLIEDDEEIHPDCERVPDLSCELRAITPETFGVMSADGLKFYELYQRYESLAQAICELNAAYDSCCLIHNDLKLSNILLQFEWELLSSAEPTALDSAKLETCQAIRLIDWEKSAWGDPAADLGTLIASYLKIWLKSLVVRAGIDLDMALRLAPVRLEAIQPSIVALVQSYLAHFPESLERFPDFLLRVLQFTGFALIESIQAKLHYHEPFGNIEICMLQVAKTLLCAPSESILTVFGVSASELLNLKHQAPLDWNCSTAVALQPNSKKLSTAVFEETRELKSEYQGSDNGYDRSALKSIQDNILQDIVSNIQLANFSVSHPYYAPAEPPEGLAERLPDLPADFQRSYLQAQLQNYLYDIYFSGEQKLAQTEARSFHASVLENNTARGLNIRFYEQLHHSNYGKGYFDPNWHVLRQTPDGIAVQKDGLTVQIDPERHLCVEARSPSIGDIVSIYLPRNRIETGFYVAVGNLGLVSDNSPAIELYFNVTPAGAISLMQSLTQRLNAINIPFLFKVLVDPAEYGRYDSGILQVERSHYQQVWQVLQQIDEAEMLKYFHAAVPLFTKALAPGIGLAEAPENSSKDFGSNRCQLIAEALLSVWGTAADHPQSRMSAIYQCFIQAKIDWQCPYLNPNSEDIYPALDKFVYEPDLPRLLMQKGMVCE